MRILFVCLGNICRSPTAEGVFRVLLEREGLGDRIEVDSAGTGGWHVGAVPDERSTRAAADRGIVLAGFARKVTPEDFTRFSLLIAMDRDNRDALLDLAPDEAARGRVHLLREFDPASRDAADVDVPDPYYDAGAGFERVLDLVEAACEGLLARVR